MTGNGGYHVLGAAGEVKTSPAAFLHTLLPFLH